MNTRAHPLLRRGAEARRRLRRALEFVVPFRGRVAWISVLALAVAGLNAGQPLVLKAIFDELGAGPTVSGLRDGLLLLLAVELARALVSARLSILTWDVRLDVEHELRTLLVGKLNALPLAYHQTHGVGGLINRFNQGISGFVNAFGEIAFNVVPALVYLVLSTLALLTLDWRLAVLVLAFAPIPAVIGAVAAREQTARDRMLLEHWTPIYSRLTEVLSGIRTVKAFAQEEVEQRRFLAGQHEGMRIVRRGVRIDVFTNGLRDLSATLARLAVIAVGALLIVRGVSTVGTLVAVLGYIAGLFGPVQGLTNAYQIVRRGSVALDTILEMLDTPDPTADAPDARSLTDVRGAVAFEQVSFAYDGTRVLHDVSLQAAPGETIAIVGPSGSGKTTLMLLLQRLYPLTSGRITIDGIDVRTVTGHSLRAHIGVVYQDVNLFNDPVSANIAYARPTADEDEIEAVARAASAHEFIARLPEGYDTLVGEHGNRLSGGQRQRVGIARAILHDPPILILDEATSALDAATEAEVQSALRTVTRGRTTFVIAHRLSTVVGADRIIILREGRITATGTHEELLADPYYASLVRFQSRGLLALDRNTGTAMRDSPADR